MTTQRDPLDAALDPDRVFYALGTLLNADDFGAEQAYHRGRLARALALLHGSGTVAGLKVEWKAPRLPSPGPPPVAARAEEIEVAPGVALDRLGRLLEIPRTACTRLARWFDQQDTDDLLAARHSATVLNPATEIDEAVDAVVADLFVRFVASPRGLTPAFATGPFDALDAAVPARVRDGYALDLLLRTEGTPPEPENPWGTPAQILETIFDAWDRATERDQEGRLVPLNEHLPGQDPTAVLLARVLIIVESGGGTDRPARRAHPSEPDRSWVVVRNDIRRIVYPSGALAKAIGL